MVVEPKNKASAGRVLIKPRGEWDANITYNMLDLVNHNGYAFLAKRTVVGIEPNGEHSTYWHSLLDIKTIIENNIAETVASEVGDILSERFSDMLSEAKYVPDLMADFTEATFVQWDTETANTPYKEGLTTITDGYALVYGNSEIVRTITAWTDGETFTYGKNGWEKAITSSGGTITGSLELAGHLGLGNGVGKISADDESTFLEAKKDAENYRRVEIENPSGDVALEDAIKFVSTKSGETKEYNVLGEHNPDKISEMGYARIQTGSYVGTGAYGKSNPNTITFKYKPNVVFISSQNGQIATIMYGNTTFYTGSGGGGRCPATWNGNTLSWYDDGNYFDGDSVGSTVGNGSSRPKWQLNELDVTYDYVAI